MHVLWDSPTGRKAVALPPSHNIIVKADTKGGVIFMGGHMDAIEDGIQFFGGHGRFTYIIPCELCGGDVKRTQYSRTRNYICNYCKGLIKKKEKIVLDHIENVETKAERRFNKAVANIEKQVKNFQAYEKAINIAKTRAEKYGSIPEAMVAIELLKNKHKIIPQQKIGKYRVDFALPDIKMVVEVDGIIFHRRTERKEDREYAIQLALGFDWKIIHIPAELAAKRITMLEKAIQKMNTMR